MKYEVIGLNVRELYNNKKSNQILIKDISDQKYCLFNIETDKNKIKRISKFKINIFNKHEIDDLITCKPNNKVYLSKKNFIALGKGKELNVGLFSIADNNFEINKKCLEKIFKQN